MVKNLSSGYDKKKILHNINLEIPDEKITVIIGPNGCGKSTLLKSMTRLITPYDGKVFLENKIAHSFPPKEFAKIVGMLPQSSVVPEGITVFDLVSRGRFPHTKPFHGHTKKDTDAIKDAISMMGLVDLEHRQVDSLSGGQRQRVWIALALAQQTDILLLDEPTTFLDITHQIEILDLLIDLNRKKKITIVMVLHDLNLSARYADYIISLKDGVKIADGKVDDVITKENIQKLFGLDCKIVPDPISGTPMVVPKGAHHY